MGGAHRDKNLILSSLRESISQNLDAYKEFSSEEILSQRKNKFLKIGRDKGFIDNLERLSATDYKKNNIEQFFKKKINILYLVGFFILLTGLLIFLL